MLEGKDEVLKNLERKRKAILNKTAEAILQGAMIGEANVKENWSNRLEKGKGFQTRTGTLVRSIQSKVLSDNEKIRGYIYSGVYYAPFVEFMLSGKYAFLWPGVNEVRDRIWDKIKQSSKGAIG